MSIVSLAKIEESNFKKAIEESLNLINYTFRKDLQNVVIKLNACYYWDYSTGQTTDPAFVASLIDLIREKTSPDISISLVESDASAMKCKYAYKFLGFEKLSKAKNVNLVNLSEEKSDPVKINCDGQSYEFMVPQIIKNADLRINLPKIKYTMKPIQLTCALKNIFGCNPYPQKFKLHPQLGNAIVALNKVMKFDLCIIDGNIVSGSQPRKLGLVMASVDPVALDVASAKIAGLNPNKIPYFKLAEREGIGSLMYSLKGESIDKYEALYPKKTFTKKVMGMAFPWVKRLGLGKRLGLE
jgi:uncharacterized protein (DUF362 family)